MAFTRFHDDPARIKKQLQESTYTGRYQIAVPGPGDHLPFWEDPNIRLQKWGANLHYGTTDFESELRGLTRPLNRDLVTLNNYNANPQIITIPVESYGVSQPFVEESRATHPAWMYRDVDIDRWESPWINPLVGIEKPFQENIQTRILEKDYFQPNIPNYMQYH